MRIVFVADGRSAIALNWIRYFVEAGHEVTLVSTYPCTPRVRLESLHVMPVAFSGLAGRGAVGRVGQRTSARLRARVRDLLGPFTVRRAARELGGLLHATAADVVHAMRIPYEGMMTASARPPAPFVVSVWGNDFTLHASWNWMMARHTRRALASASALHSDCWRDVRLAREWGFAAHKPIRVLPSAGGVELDVFGPLAPPPGEPVVINARGIRGYVRTDTFFRAIPLVLERRPDARFVCPAMRGREEAERWVRQLGLADVVRLLPAQSREDMAHLFRRAQVAVSLSTHDGTPNTLLEAMACGCCPVVGDIESLREWITDGRNGFLVNPGSPSAVAEAILRALADSEMRSAAREANLELIRERAEYSKVMREVEVFYREVIR